jgi:hypothetical protein
MDKKVLAAATASPAGSKLALASSQSTSLIPLTVALLEPWVRAALFGGQGKTGSLIGSFYWTD